jgi:hypothetical protein
VAIDAALVRVVDGKTLLRAANLAERCPNWSGTLSLAVIRSA